MDYGFAALRQSGMTSWTFPASGTRPILGHGEKPRSTGRAEGARSGQAFEKGPGQADARQGGAAGRRRRSIRRWRICSIPPSARAAPASARRPGLSCANLPSPSGEGGRWGASQGIPPAAQRSDPHPGPSAQGTRKATLRVLRPPRRLRQRAPGARVGGARLRRGTAAGLCRQDAGAARRTRSRPRPRTRHRRGRKRRRSTLRGT